MAHGASIPRALEHVLAAAAAAAPGQPVMADIADDCTISASADGCIIHIARQQEDEPEYAVMSLAFAEGRGEATQQRLAQALEMHPSAAHIKEAMLDTLELIVPAPGGERALATPADKRKRLDRARGPLYFMLSDEDELETLEDGSMDGSPALRQSCAAWHLLTIATAADLAVYFVGYPYDYDAPPLGGAKLFAGPGWQPLCLDGAQAEPLPADRPSLPLPADRPSLPLPADRPSLPRQVATVVTHLLDILGVPT